MYLLYINLLKSVLANCNEQYTRSLTVPKCKSELVYSHVALLLYDSCQKIFNATTCRNNVPFFLFYKCQEQFKCIIRSSGFCTPQCKVSNNFIYEVTNCPLSSVSITSKCCCQCRTYLKMITDDN